jgi:hypothetical protein
MDLAQLEPTLVGVTGEYYVAAELSIRGYLASMTLRNSRGIDIIAANSDASRSVSIQVKTSKKGSPRWVLTKKVEDFHSENHYYVFTRLNEIGQRPDFYIVPSKVVADYCFTTHRQWLLGTKKDGTPHKDSAVRLFEDREDTYRERWDLLGL